MTRGYNEVKLLKSKIVVAFNTLCTKKIVYVIDLFVVVINQKVSKKDNVMTREH